MSAGAIPSVPQKGDRFRQVLGRDRGTVWTVLRLAHGLVWVVTDDGRGKWVYPSDLTGRPGTYLRA